ncbi:MAG: hypothetical protein PQJ46_14065, partial [Spirochaetales bacterium]|nr:hypothetical protein [Spirochaetales bacterium]
TEDFSEYALIADVFQKNASYNIKLKFAYQTETITLENNYAKELNNIVFATDITITPVDFISIITGIEGGLYSFGYLKDLENDNEELLSFNDTLSKFLFNVKLGVVMNFDNLNK